MKKISSKRILSFRRLVVPALLSCLFAGSPPAVLAAETFRVAYNNSGMPFSAMNIQTQKMEGFMVDLTEALAKEEGFNISSTSIEFNALIPALTSGKIDISSAPMYSTEARSKVVSFSTPLYTYGEGLLVKSDVNEAYTSLESLKGQKVGAVSGTLYIDRMNKLGIFSEVKAYTNDSDLMRDLVLGRIKAGVVDAPLIAFELKDEHNNTVKLVESYVPEMVGSIAIAVPKTKPELLNTVNQGIVKLRADGRYDALLKKWALTN